MNVLASLYAAAAAPADPMPQRWIWPDVPEIVHGTPA